MSSLEAARGAFESPKEEGKDESGPPASTDTARLKRGREEADNDNAPPEQKQRSESGVACNINANDPDNMRAEGGYDDGYKDNQEARHTVHSGSAAILRQEDNAMDAANLATSRILVRPDVSSFQAGMMQQQLFMNAGRMPTVGGQQIPASWQQAYPQTTSQHHLQNYVLEPANQQNALGVQPAQHQNGGEQQDEDIVGNSDVEKTSQPDPPFQQPAAAGDAVPVAGEGAHAAPHGVLPATMIQEMGGQKTTGMPSAAAARANATTSAGPATDHDHSQNHFSLPQGAPTQLPEAKPMALHQQGMNTAQMHPNAAQFYPQMFQHDNKGNIAVQSGVPGKMCMFMPPPTMMRPFFVAPHMGRPRFVPSSGLMGQPLLVPRTNGICLTLSCDNEQLSDYQIYVRKQLEMFEALQEDVESNTQGRKKQVVLGQVGIRCRHCTGFPVRQRGRGAVYYPTKLQGKWKALSGGSRLCLKYYLMSSRRAHFSFFALRAGIYQAAQNMASTHLCESCQCIPPNLKNDLRLLRERRNTAGGGKQYWAEAARAMGIQETGEGGLRLRRRGGVGEPVPTLS